MHVLFNNDNFFHNQITKATAVLGQFTVKDWIWTNESMLKLRSELENTDEASLKAFDFELKSFDWKKYLDNYCLGTRHYLLKNKPETLDSSRKHLKRLKYLHLDPPTTFLDKI